MSQGRLRRARPLRVQHRLRASARSKSPAEVSQALLYCRHCTAGTVLPGDVLQQGGHTPPACTHLRPLPMTQAPRWMACAPVLTQVPAPSAKSTSPPPSTCSTLGETSQRLRPPLSPGSRAAWAGRWVQLQWAVMRMQYGGLGGGCDRVGWEVGVIEGLWGGAPVQGAGRWVQNSDTACCCLPEYAWGGQAVRLVPRATCTPACTSACTPPRAPRAAGPRWHAPAPQPAPGRAPVTLPLCVLWPRQRGAVHVPHRPPAPPEVRGQLAHGLLQRQAAAARAVRPGGGSTVVPACRCASVHACTGLSMQREGACSGRPSGFSLHAVGLAPGAGTVGSACLLIDPCGRFMDPCGGCLGGPLLSLAGPPDSGPGQHAHHGQGPGLGPGHCRG